MNEVNLILWNGLAQRRQEIVEMPISSSVVKVSTEDGDLISQVVESPPSITNYNEKAQDSKHTLLFTADLPPLGFRAFRLLTSSDKALSAQDVSPAHIEDP